MRDTRGVHCRMWFIATLPTLEEKNTCAARYMGPSLPVKSSMSRATLVCCGVMKYTAACEGWGCLWRWMSSTREMPSSMMSDMVQHEEVTLTVISSITSTFHSPSLPLTLPRRSFCAAAPPRGGQGVGGGGDAQLAGRRGRLGPRDQRGAAFPGARGPRTRLRVTSRKEDAGLDIAAPVLDCFLCWVLCWIVTRARLARPPPRDEPADPAAR
mmetsp:Transcript_529/g.1623  ORF Transcript_529/g.1623 Transcript_529/m.1623 type:complete len:212 (-) Transcript_529:109-744(-)